MLNMCGGGGVSPFTFYSKKQLGSLIMATLVNSKKSSVDSSGPRIYRRFRFCFVSMVIVIQLPATDIELVLKNYDFIR